jgi:hypothetical protein
VVPLSVALLPSFGVLAVEARNNPIEMKVIQEQIQYKFSRGYYLQQFTTIMMTIEASDEQLQN